MTDNNGNLITGQMTAEEREYLMERIERRLVKSRHGCWTWRGSKGAGGYPQIGVNGKAEQLRRVMFELFFPEKRLGHYVVESTCGNTGCCKPEHLRKGSRTRD